MAIAIGLQLWVKIKFVELLSQADGIAAHKFSEPICSRLRKFSSSNSIRLRKQYYKFYLYPELVPFLLLVLTLPLCLEWHLNV